MADHKDSIDFEQVDAGALIEDFGGIRPMAQKLGIAASTVQGWKARNHIPPSRVEEILRVAHAEGLDMDSLRFTQPGEGEAIFLDDRSSHGDADKEPPTRRKEQPAENIKNVTEDQAAAPPPAEAAGLRGGHGIAWLALILALAVGGGLLTRPAWGPAVDQRLAPLLSRFVPAGLVAPAPGDDAMARLDAGLSELVPALSMANANKETLETIEQRVERLSKLSASVPALSADIQLLKERIAMSGDGADMRDARLDSLIEDVEKRFAQIDARLQAERGDENAPGDFDGLVKRLGEISSRQNIFGEQLARLEENFQPDTGRAIDQRLEILRDFDARLQQQLDNLAASLEQISALQARERDQHAAALVVALGQLEGEVLSGRAYEGALQNFVALAKDDTKIMQSVSALAPYAASGVSTRAVLHRHFAKLAPGAETNDRKARAQDWVAATLENIRGLISIRRIGADPDLSPVSRAESALDRGDLQSAIAAAAEIGETAAVAEWLRAAQARLAAEQSLTDLRAIALSFLVNSDRSARTGQ